ncbi:MAG: hypothetical protein WC052_05330 [Patescibacteria group bacterium]
MIKDLFEQPGKREAAKGSLESVVLHPGYIFMKEALVEHKAFLEGQLLHKKHKDLAGVDDLQRKIELLEFMLKLPDNLAQYLDSPVQHDTEFDPYE